MTVQLLVLALTLLSLNTAEGFSVLPRNDQLKALSTFGSSLTAKNPSTTKLYSQSNDDNEEDEEADLIEKQNFFREIMGSDETGESKKKAKGKQPKGIKRPHDNRDDLPFLVQVMTPPDDSDLYNQQVMEQKKKKRKKLTRKQRRQGIFHEDEDEDDGEIVGETLGEYRFEKNTGSGDKIEIDEQVYVVTKARCQYRYAGAQKFEMVRKILQVKPVQRAMQEDYIMRQFNAPSARESE